MNDKLEHFIGLGIASACFYSIWEVQDSARRVFLWRNLPEWLTGIVCFFRMSATLSYAGDILIVWFSRRILERSHSINATTKDVSIWGCVGQPGRINSRVSRSETRCSTSKAQTGTSQAVSAAGRDG